MPKRKPATIRVGVAGWDYPDWQGVVYPQPGPKAGERVRFLAHYIDLIEINSSFYGPPRPAVSRRWAELAADLPDFRYTAKLWRRFTHERGEAWTATEVRQVEAGFAPLLEAGRLDAVLAQFPWSFKNEEPNREWLADLAGTFAELPLVVEVRHASWNDPEFYGWLAAEGIGFVNIDQPLFRRSLEPSARRTAGVGYIRVHGRNYQDWFRKDAGRDARYDYLYEPEQLEPWVDRARELAGTPGTPAVDVVFNNHYKGKAVVNALQFRSELEARQVPAPPPLVAAYPDALRGMARPAPPGALGGRSAA
ncbi:MAG TPA: DUF72 domain-containing protein [Longimicrobiales bacterium]|nr:DUF72 domain-containing protein [Longimicrobiales bacterium]